MPKAELGQLVSVSLTNAWKNEPQDFTPWLAQNLELLSAAIGVPLADPQQEVRCDPTGSDRFCADIVALTPEGSPVLIENQFTDSDHIHLGQILTYVAGVKAKIVIWIAPKFRESHRSAIRWLNSHTHEDYAFFAVELRVLRIGDSMMAPFLDVVERPNQWERRLIERQREIAAPQIGEKREFWDAYVRLYPNAAKDPGGGGRGSTRWRIVPDTDLVVARWVSGNSVGLFVRGGRGEGADPFYELSERAQRRLAKKLGAGLDEERYPLDKWWDEEFDGRKNWEAAIHWLEGQTQAYVAAITEEAGGAA